MPEDQFQQNQGQPTGDTKDDPVVENADHKMKGSQAGPVIGSIIVIIVLVLGGLYFIGQKVTKEGVFEPGPEEILNAPDLTLETLKEQGTSDEVSAIEEDLDATMLEDLDAELQDIESELNF